jgi:hypothetical protein
VRGSSFEGVNDYVRLSLDRGGGRPMTHAKLEGYANERQGEKPWTTLGWTRYNKKDGRGEARGWAGEKETKRGAGNQSAG